MTIRRSYILNNELVYKEEYKIVTDLWERAAKARANIIKNIDERVMLGCIKCPQDINKYCDYCGIRQSDGDEAAWSLNRVRLP